ncbi:hypothetical protein [Escherichia phage UPEC06]|nr:hypothetical protein [Escherichia phage UPEC06]
MTIPTCQTLYARLGIQYYIRFPWLEASRQTLYHYNLFISFINYIIIIHFIHNYY